MRSIGIYPGTFDPIHEGHIAFAKQAVNECNLSMVIFLPESNPRKKENVTDAKKRLSVIQSRIKNDETLKVAKLTSPQFTVAGTLPEIQYLTRNLPSTLLIGSDVALFLHTWDDVATLVKTCSLAIGMRSGQSQEDVIQAMQLTELKCETKISYTLIYTDFHDVASSQYR